MSAFGNNFLFGVRLAARDDTQSALASARSGFDRFRSIVAKPITVPLQIARSGLGFLRDVNLGLRPLVQGIDNLIERGAGLEVVRKSFESLTGVSGRSADLLARSLVSAAGGTIRLAEGMQIANRALGSGLGFEQVRTAVEFISKKAISTGKNAGEALNTVITGLARGSTLFLDDLGILVDGVDGVKAAFDRIKGVGAFDSLGPAAQKAEIVRQAISQMEQQLGRIGVTGRETIFTFSGIKNEIGNMVDSLVLAVAKSQGLRSALTGLRDFLAGISEHFSKGGTFGQLFFGKGQSGGLFGIAKAGLLDLGETIGRGIAGGALVGLSRLPDLFGMAIEKLKGLLAPLTEAIENAVAVIQELPQALAEHVGSLIGSAGDFLLKNDTTRGATLGLMGMTFPVAEMVSRWLGLPTVSAGPTSRRATQPASTNPLLNLFLLAGTSSLGAGERSEGIAAMLRRTGLGLLSGVGGGRFRGELDAFLRVFAPSTKAGEQGAIRSLLDADRPTLTPAGFARGRGELELYRRQSRRVAAEAEREARRVEAEEARELRRQGFELSPGARDRRREELRRQIAAQREPKLSALGERVGSELYGRDAANAQAQADQAKQSSEGISKLVGKADELLKVLGQAVAALVGGERDLARA